MPKESQAFAALVIVTAALTAMCASPTHATDLPFHPDDVSEGLVWDLARVFVSEADFHDPQEHAALGHTIARRTRRLRRVRGWRARTSLRMIADRALVEPRTNRQRWIHRLRLDGRQPVGWSTLTTVPWAGERSEGWAEALREARELVAGRLADPCDGPSELWGSRTHPTDTVALRRNIRSGVWVVVDCGSGEGRRDNVYVRWGSRAERSAAARQQRRGRPQVTFISPN